MTDDLTPREVAAQLGVTVRTVQRWIAAGRLPAARVGDRVRVSRSSLAAVAGGPVQRLPGAAGGPMRTLLIANRGEIAARIGRTARRLGLRVVAVHEPGDRPPAGADEVAEIGSYRDGDAILAAAQRSGSDAIHPGYGFLAENASFAAAVEASAVRWVGPPADAIAAMGDKAAARRRAAAHGVPTVPGYDGEAQDDETLAAEAGRIGFPLLVKPSAGGGGKGMRVVDGPTGLVEALAAARREAHRSFGDDRLILERYLAGSRHVEVQVLFDAVGEGVHLGERDCSAQRRNQKIIEEAPAASVTPELRERMGSAALAVALAAGYRSAGTVEMLLTDAGEFYFLEMNTRLQVEHPVTEAVTGRDLVADQLRIADGATLAELGLGRPPPIGGHAMEARIYAEDPESGFLPATGRLHLVRWPRSARVDSGVETGDEVSDRYDPMLAKVIVHAATRAEAIDALRVALAETSVLGVRTNVRFLRWLLDRPEMRTGEVRTDTIAGLEIPGLPPLSDGHWTAAARLLEPAASDPWAGGWRLNAAPVRRVRWGDVERSVAIDADERDDGPMAVADVNGSTVHVEVDGQSIEFSAAEAPGVEEAARHAAAAGDAATAVLVAPMPGRVISVRASPGSPVRAQDPVVVIEAMKMEHAVVSPIDGTLARLEVHEGDQVRRGDRVGEVSADEPDASEAVSSAAP